MRADNLEILDRITLSELEQALDTHTREKVEPDKWTAFSWSASRHKMFEDCKRRYYLNYYGARRVREAKNPVTSAVWWLKQVTPVRTWIGTVIHHVASLAVQAHRDEKEIDEKELIDTATRYHWEGWLASKRGAKHDGQWIILFEHLYPGDGLSIDRDAAEALVVDLTRTFLASDAYGFIKYLPPGAVREVDPPFQSFELTGVPAVGKLRVYAIPDVLLHDGQDIYIIDWKTGSAAHESIRWQAGVYRLYAHQTYLLPEQSIHVSIADLENTGESIEPTGGIPPLDETRTFISASVQAMLGRLDDVAYNTASIHSFPMTDDLAMCRQCSFKRACWRHE
ncbi:MAG: PD-(D/E)XK nuclease family protein [Anaerolineae bacterium]|nr:PD-(D/E)XK nuclease family protein [Anaerolineae bacterium]